MNTLVVGATGSTGRLLVKQLMSRGHHVRAIVRSPHKVPEAVKSADGFSMIEAPILDLPDAELARSVEGCDAVASCLGHPMTLKGIWGPPRRLVTEATERLCRALRANEPDTPAKLVLMNTAGYRNPDQNEQISFAQTCILGLLRAAVPPHTDNEQAADYLRTGIGQDDGTVEWAVVRPDDLTDEDRVTEYEVHASPIRSALFDAGETSRINVAHFMADLITDYAVWNRWRGQMPVIYNQSSPTESSR